MSNSNPLVPQGSLLEQQARRKSTFQLAAFIVALHVVGLSGVLFSACKKEENQPPPPAVDTFSAPPPVFSETRIAPPPLTDPYAPPTDSPAYVPPVVNPPFTAPPSTIPEIIPEATIPAPFVSTPPPTIPIPSLGTEHVVQKGDIAYNLARKHGVTLKQMQEANPGRDLARLKVGDKVQIPAAVAGASSPSVASSGFSTSTSTTTYTVKGGDNLSRLAKKFGTTVKAIRDANGMTSNDIKVGQKLRIPGNSTGATTRDSVTTPAPLPLAPPLVTPGAPVTPP